MKAPTKNGYYWARYKELDYKGKREWRVVQLWTQPCYDHAQYVSCFGQIFEKLDEFEWGAKIEHAKPTTLKDRK